MLEGTLEPNAQIAVKGTKCFNVIVNEAKIFVYLLVEHQVYFVYEIHLSHKLCSPSTLSLFYVLNIVDVVMSYVLNFIYLVIFMIFFAVYSC